jgi:hypothetical protein
MNYREIAYRNALESVRAIYEKSKYDKDVDLYRSIDIINSVSKWQFESKEWLVKELLPHLPEKLEKIAILGSWYGLVSIILREHISEDVVIRNVDSDPVAKTIGAGFLKDIEKAHKNTYFLMEDAADHIFEKSKAYDCIINTSCEHMEKDDLRFIVDGKQSHTVVCLQSNNYHSIQSHINTHNSLEEFVEEINLPSVYYSGILKAKEYDRYMVIGR